jgi:hypothetical protein
MNAWRQIIACASLLTAATVRPARRALELELRMLGVLHRSASLPDRLGGGRRVDVLRVIDVTELAGLGSVMRRVVVVRRCLIGLLAQPAAPRAGTCGRGRRREAPPLVTAGAQASTAAGEGGEELEAADGTADAGEALLQVAAGQELLDGRPDDRAPEAVALLRFW